MVNVATSAALTTPTNVINRTKYFPVEIFCANMLPQTTYDAYSNGQLINAFCRPYGGNLGYPLTADANGKLRFQYHMAIPYNQSNLVNPHVGNTNTFKTATSITLIDPFNNASTIKLNTLLKSGSS